MQFFMSEGFTRAQAAGIAGNLVVESGDYLNPAEPGGGIGQWGGSRLKSMLRFEGGRPNFKRQVQLVWQELTRSPPRPGRPAMASNSCEKPRPRKGLRSFS